MLQQNKQAGRRTAALAQHTIKSSDERNIIQNVFLQECVSLRIQLTRTPQCATILSCFLNMCQATPAEGVDECRLHLAITYSNPQDANGTPPPLPPPPPPRLPAPFVLPALGASLLLVLEMCSTCHCICRRLAAAGNSTYSALPKPRLATLCHCLPCICSSRATWCSTFRSTVPLFLSAYCTVMDRQGLLCTCLPLHA